MSISSVSSSSSYGSYATSSASSKRNSTDNIAKLFSKIDSDGDGSLNTDELQTLIDKAPSSGGSSGSSVSAADMLKKLDSDGDGSVSKDELGSGLKAMKDELDSQFQQMRMQAGSRPPPPPQGSGSSDDEEDLFGQLDTDGDGSVTKTEFSKLASSDESSSTDSSKLDELFSKIDSDGDGSITKAEDDTFKQQMQTQGPQGGSRPHGPPPSGAAPDSGDSSSSSAGSDDKLAFISQLLQQYTQGVDNSSDTTSSLLAVTA